MQLSNQLIIHVLRVDPLVLSPLGTLKGPQAFYLAMHVPFSISTILEEPITEISISFWFA